MADWSYESLDEHYKKNFTWFEIPVIKGDTLETIYAKALALNPYCLNLNDIKALNNIITKDIPVGTKIKVFGVYKVKHRLTKIDTVSQILMTFSLTIEELEKANPYIDSKIETSIIQDIVDNLTPFSDDRKFLEGALINFPATRIPTSKFVQGASDAYQFEAKQYIRNQTSRAWTGQPPVNNLNVKPLDYYEDLFPSHRKMNSRYKLRIGDCMFFIPPEFIQVNKQSSANEFSMLRQQGTMKTHNGFAMTRIEITLWFTDLEQINGFPVESPNGKDNPYYMDGLRPLIAQFKRNPFLPIENELLNNVFNIYSVALMNLAFSTVQQLPGTIQANLILYKMEMFPLLERPNWMYDKMIVYPLFRSYYQQALTKENTYSNIYLKEVTDNNFTDKIKMSILKEGNLKELNNKNTKITVSALDNAIKEYQEVTLPDDLYCVSITASTGTIISPISMTSHDTPTFQYMGASDTTFIIKFETTNKKAVSDLYFLYETCLRYSREYRNRIVSGYVKLENQLINMCGVKYAMIVDLTVATVPEYPGLYMITMTATSHEANQHSFERLKGFNGLSNHVTRILEYNLEIINFVTKDIQDKDMVHMVEELNAESIIDTLELYPDLALPKYSMVNEEIQKINKFRKSKGLKEMPIDKHIPPSIRYKYWDENQDRYKMLSDEHYVDPDFYMIYPSIDFFKDEMDEGSKEDYELRLSGLNLAKEISSIKKEDFDNLFSEEINKISDEPITGLSFTEDKREVTTGVLLEANQYAKHPDVRVKKQSSRLSSAAKYNDFYLEMSKKYGIDEKLLLVAAAFESTGNPISIGPNLGTFNKATGLYRINSIDCGLMQINVILSEEDEKRLIQAMKKSAIGKAFFDLKETERTSTKYKNLIRAFLTDEAFNKGNKDAIEWMRTKIHVGNPDYASKDNKGKLTTTVYELLNNPRVCVQFAANLYVEKRNQVRQDFDKPNAAIFGGFTREFEARCMFIYYMRRPSSKNTSDKYVGFRDVWEIKNNKDKGMGDRVLWGSWRYDVWLGLQTGFKNESGKKQGTKTVYVPKQTGNKIITDEEREYEIDVLVPIPEDQTKDTFYSSYQSMTKTFIKNNMRNEAKKYSKTGRLIRAFPTYCLVFVDEGITIDYRRIWNNYYAYHAIQDISVVKERENPVDTAYIRLSNVYGALDFIDKELAKESAALYKIGTNIDNISKFVSRNFNAESTTAQVENAAPGETVRILNDDGETKMELLSEFYEVIVGQKQYSAKEVGLTELVSQYWNAWFPQISSQVARFRLNQVSSFGIMLKTGARVHLRLGYGSIASKMPIAFNGTITEMTEGDILDIVCQSDGMELTNSPFSDDPNEYVNWYSFDQEPREVLEQMMIRRRDWDTVAPLIAGYEADSVIFKSVQLGLIEQSKYGIQHFGTLSSPVSLLNLTADSLFNTFDITKNIYVATLDGVIDPATASRDEESFYFYINDKKPWDIFKFYESCIPEFEAKIFEHGFHSTVFFGKPHWYARTKYYITDDRINQKFFEAIRIAQQLHEYDSMSNIVSNNITTSHNHFSTIVIPLYKRGALDSAVALNPIYLDRNIKTEYQKTEFVDTSQLQDYLGPDWFYDVAGAGLSSAKEWILEIKNAIDEIGGNKQTDIKAREGPDAKKFAYYSALTHMRHSLRDMYEGELIILGDAAVRPGDIFTMQDGYTLISGAAEVGRVIHHFSLETGFITTIKPDLISILAKPEDGSLQADGYVNYNIRKGILANIGVVASTLLLFFARKAAAKALVKRIEIPEEYEEVELDKNDKPVFEKNENGTIKLDDNDVPIEKKVVKTRNKQWIGQSLLDELKFLRNSIRTGSYSTLIGSSPVLSTGIFGVGILLVEFTMFAAIDYYTTKLIDSFIHRDAGIKLFPLFKRGKPYVSGISGHRNLIPGYIDESAYGNLQEEKDAQFRKTANEFKKEEEGKSLYNGVTLDKVILQLPANTKYCYPVESSNGKLNIQTKYFQAVKEDFKFGLMVADTIGSFYKSPGIELKVSNNKDTQNVHAIASGTIVHLFDKTTTNTSGLNVSNFNKKLDYGEYGVIIKIKNDRLLELDDKASLLFGMETVEMENHLMPKKLTGVLPSLGYLEFNLTTYPDVDIYAEEELPDAEDTEVIYVILFGLSNVVVKENEDVRVGQVIGEFKKTGRLYMEMQDIENIPFDPYYFLRQVDAHVFGFDPKYLQIKT